MGYNKGKQTTLEGVRIPLENLSSFYKTLEVNKG
jgi:hypothetical protein